MRKNLFDNFKLDCFIRDETIILYKMGRSKAITCVPGWIDVKAALMIAYSNKKHQKIKKGK